MQECEPRRSIPSAPGEFLGRQVPWIERRAQLAGSARLATPRGEAPPRIHSQDGTERSRDGGQRLVDAAWPPWWDWELELSPHLLKRMVDRQFSETTLRRMLEEARSYHPDTEPGRWVIVARHAKGAWEVIVEPDEALRLLVVITAYPLD